MPFRITINDTFTTESTCYPLNPPAKIPYHRRRSCSHNLPTVPSHITTCTPPNSLLVNQKALLRRRRSFSVSILDGSSGSPGHLTGGGLSLSLRMGRQSFGGQEGSRAGRLGREGWRLRQDGRQRASLISLQFSTKVRSQVPYCLWALCLLHF